MTLEFVGQGHMIAEETVTRHLQPDHSSQHAAGVQPDTDRQRHAVRLGHVASGCERQLQRCRKTDWLDVQLNEFQGNNKFCGILLQPI